ncbi:MAG: hypothetical protein AB7I42_24180 [Bradyrhizobium sp.]|uniref:hypothetical protein n=1 Tax=Bradyrhizobium sp. TaxID=376 RepID=UPI003D0994E8
MTDHAAALSTLGIRMERLDWIPRSWRFPRIPADLDQRYPYFGLVPTDMVDNIDFRMELLRLGQKPENQYELWLMCRRDSLFWLGAFGWIFESRDAGGDLAELPWIPHPFQVATWAEADDVWGRESLAVEKSRAQGATWLLHVARPCWDLQFSVNAEIGLASRVAELLDDIGDMGTTFEKIGFMLNHQPHYLKPPDLIDKLFNINAESRRNSIVGEATTPNIFRGKRKRVVGIDEGATIDNSLEVNAALASVTNCIVDVSTPRGAFGRFWDKVKPGSETRKVTQHWTLNPQCNEGLRFDAEPLTKNPNYRNGRPWSPWYENECKKLGYHPVLIAQELDISYQASDYQFFPDVTLRAIQDKCSRPAVKRGKLLYDVTRDAEGRVTALRVKEFVECEDGWLWLWCQCRSDGSPVRGAYAMGCDISMGTGASNSAATIKDKGTGERAGMIVTSRHRPHEFAEICVAVGRWFGGPNGECRMGWERNGPGGTFGDTVLQIGYGNYYMHQEVEKLGKPTTRKPGWWSYGRAKRDALEAYSKALSEGTFVERSEIAFEEHRLYIVKPNGQITHVSAENTEDPTGAGDNHGDIVIANVVCEIVAAQVDTEVAEDDDSTLDPLSWEARWREKRRKEAVVTRY